ncbi:nucleoside/nucleotide kinase family protein [Streptomyces sp. YIM 98790]|uniref:nucleoside/nucleotide kinase family protein n=1 Tax=Streptomyces sp. YIM 98790 TaxID=2689077 RepID=UPI001FB71109|nr:nucleoside/nucleotide kinase family protein [Streptomyces sp. YIM 98790]
MQPPLSPGSPGSAPSGPAALTALAADALALLPASGRAVLGLAGPPGAGKSTLARALVAALGPDTAAHVPLDGFHLSNAQLDRLGLRSRKGSEPSFDVRGYTALLRSRKGSEPSFDVRGYTALLHRLLTETGPGSGGGGGGGDIYVPDFDRALDEPVAARHHVPPAVRLIVTEGNYLACDLPSWTAARALMAEVWYVDAPEAERDVRLMDRHTGYGRSPGAARAWIDSNDRPNAELVVRSRPRCDRTVTAVLPGLP